MKVAVWIVAVYLALDFADPGMPGALNFDPDQSVEVVHVQRFCPMDIAVVSSAEPTAFDCVNVLATTERPVVRNVASSRPPAPVRFAQPRLVPPPSEDLPSPILAR